MMKTAKELREQAKALGIELAGIDLRKQGAKQALMQRIQEAQVSQSNTSTAQTQAITTKATKVTTNSKSKKPRELTWAQKCKKANQEIVLLHPKLKTHEYKLADYKAIADTLDTPEMLLALHSWLNRYEVRVDARLCERYDEETHPEVWNKWYAALEQTKTYILERQMESRGHTPLSKRPPVSTRKPKPFQQSEASKTLGEFLTVTQAYPQLTNASLTAADYCAVADSISDPEELCWVLYCLKEDFGNRDSAFVAGLSVPGSVAVYKETKYYIEERQRELCFTVVQEIAGYTVVLHKMDEDKIRIRVQIAPGIYSRWYEMDNGDDLVALLQDYKTLAHAILLEGYKELPRVTLGNETLVQAPGFGVLREVKVDGSTYVDVADFLGDIDNK